MYVRSSCKQHNENWKGLVLKWWKWSLQIHLARCACAVDPFVPPQILPSCCHWESILYSQKIVQSRLIVVFMVLCLRGQQSWEYHWIGYSHQFTNHLLYIVNYYFSLTLMLTLLVTSTCMLNDFFYIQIKLHTVWTIDFFSRCLFVKVCFLKLPCTMHHFSRAPLLKVKKVTFHPLRKQIGK